MIGYRKKSVIYNLKLAFPEKSQLEIKAISKKFYHHFVDVFIEMIKSFTISEKEILEHYKFTNVEILNDLEAKKKSVVLLGSHYANWEWIFSLNLLVSSNGYAVYKKLSNPFFDKKTRETRGKYRTTLVPTKDIYKVISSNSKNNIISIYGFLGDQSPKINKVHYWSKFLNVKVPIHTGAEMLAKKNNLSVVAFHTKKVKRGYYESTFKLLAENPNDFKNYEITDLYLKELENSIFSEPEYYFWTHKRFKHKDKAPI